MTGTGQNALYRHYNLYRQTLLPVICMLTRLFVNNHVAFEKTAGCKFKAYLEAMKAADMVIAVYDPDDPLCEREAAAAAVAGMLNKQVLTLDPKAIRFQ